MAAKRLLIVEDEFLVALDIEDVLTAAGFEVIGPASTCEEALAQIESQPLAAALLDANLHGRPVDVVAAALDRLGIPFMFVTGYGRESLPEAFRNAPLIAKPFDRQGLLAEVERLLTGTSRERSTVTSPQ